MEFTFDTVYHQKAVTAMAKGLRKTIRRKRSRRSHIFGWLLVALSLFLALPFGDEEWVFGVNTVVTLLVTLFLLAALLFEDRLNGYFARKRMLAGTNRAVSVFHEEGYRSTSEIGETQWHYEAIKAIAETGDHFVFVFDQNHAQVYDKNALSGGTAEEFRKFIAEKTGMEVQQIK